MNGTGPQHFSCFWRVRNILERAAVKAQQVFKSDVIEVGQPWLAGVLPAVEGAGQDVRPPHNIGDIGEARCEACLTQFYGRNSPSLEERSFCVHIQIVCLARN